jgi:hypothetical protein
MKKQNKIKIILAIAIFFVLTIIAFLTVLNGPQFMSHPKQSSESIYSMEGIVKNIDVKLDREGYEIDRDIKIQILPQKLSLVKPIKALDESKTAIVTENTEFFKFREQEDGSFLPAFFRFAELKKGDRIIVYSEADVIKQKEFPITKLEVYE